ncbi:hypothetical protein Thermus77412_19760 [Thermus antranikianii]
MRGRFPQHAPYQLARAYAAMGYRVLPLLPGEKRPHGALVPHGLKQASREAATLEAWWRACPECGVGLLPGPEVLTLDFDDPEAWARLKEEHPTLLEAPRARTPRGGAHVYVRVPPHLGASLRTGRAKGLSELGPVDVKGLGRGYLVAPPTRISTGSYVWERPLAPPEALPPCPEPLLGLLLPPPPPPPPEARPGGAASPKRLQGLLEWACREVAATPPGNRHNRLLALARLMGGYCHLGLDPEEAAHALAQAGVEAGLPWGEALRTARDGVRYGMLDPLDLEPSPKPPEPRTYRGRVYARLRRWA